MVNVRSLVLQAPTITVKKYFHLKVRLFVLSKFKEIPGQILISVFKTILFKVYILHSYVLQYEYKSLFCKT